MKRRVKTQEKPVVNFNAKGNIIREEADIFYELLEHSFEGSEPGEISSQDFKRACKNRGLDGNEWPRLVQVMKSFLDRSTGIPGFANIKRGQFSVPRHWGRYVTKDFRSDQHAKEKALIADLVIKHLEETTLNGEPLSCFLGSGSSLFWVGRRMIRKAHPKQLFYTINLALACEWCERDVVTNEAAGPPVARVSLPEGEVETGSFRFATLRPPTWVPAVVVVGADGCLYTEDGKVVLYARREATAVNSAYFVTRASHTVIVCLTRAKMGEGPKGEGGQHSGPPIVPPTSSRVQRLVMTDHDPGPDIRNAFQRSGWTIKAPPKAVDEQTTMSSDAKKGGEHIEDEDSDPVFSREELEEKFGSMSEE